MGGLRPPEDRAHYAGLISGKDRLPKGSHPSRKEGDKTPIRREYPTVAALERGLQVYFLFYNHERPHQSLGNRVPAEVFSHA